MKNLHEIFGNIGRQLFIEDDCVRVRFTPGGDYELVFRRHEDRFEEIRQRERRGYTIPVLMELRNRRTGKEWHPMRTYINSWWLHKFVFSLAAAVNYMEQEWDTISPEKLKELEELLRRGV